MTLIAIVAFGVIAVVVLLGASQVLQTLTGRQRHDGQPARQTRRAGPGAGLVVAGVTGAALLCMLAFVGVRQSEHSPPSRQATQFQHGETESTAVVATTVEVQQTSLENGEGETASVPEWTRHPKIILEEGLVGRTQFVAASQAASTEDEARREATMIATENLRKRLSEAYPDLKDRPIPTHVFAAHSQTDSHTEVKMVRFGAYEEPMYRVFLKYEDSAQARQPIVEVWQRSVVDTRVVEMGAVVGIATLCLGTLSAFLRIFLAAPGKRRGPVVTTAAFAAAAGAIVFLA